MNVSGVLDETFGQQGVTCVTRSAPYPFDNYRLAVQASGEPLLVISSNGRVPLVPDGNLSIATQTMCPAPESSACIG